MLSQKIQTTIEKADQYLEAAENEMFKAAEDVVPHMACSSARQSILNYLNGFLLTKGMEIDTPISLEDLINKCSDIDPKFDQLNLNIIHCRSVDHDFNYCTDLKKIEDCIKVAALAKKLVVDTDHWPISKPIK